MRKYKTCPECGEKSDECECALQGYNITLLYEDGNSYTKRWFGALADGLKEFESNREGTHPTGIIATRL